MKTLRKIKKCFNYEARLRKAFERYRTLTQKMKIVIRFMRRDEDTESSEKKIDTKVNYLLRFKWDEETLKKEILVQCSKDQELKREIKMKEYERSEQITLMMKKFDKVIEDDNDGVNTIQSYRQGREKEKPRQMQYEYVS